jgi:cell division transport system permease protein
MLPRLIASPADRHLLEGRPLSGPTPWVIAIMSFSMMIVAATGLALANMAGSVSQSVEHRYSVQVPDGGRELGRLVAALRSAPGVTSAEPVAEADLRETLRRWLGPAADSSELPIPALVNFDVRPGTDIGAVAARVQGVAPQARVAGHAQSLGPLLGSLRALQWLAIGLVLLLGIAAAAAVVLATRGALDTHRFTIEVMHGIGATDLQVTRLFQRKIAMDSFVGSVAGAAAAGIVLALLFGGTGFGHDLTGGVSLGAGHILALALLPVALTILATVVARLAVLAALREAL